MLSATNAKAGFVKTTWSREMKIASVFAWNAKNEGFYTRATANRPVYSTFYLILFLLPYFSIKFINNVVFSIKRKRW